jgi:bifunctional non-homologous end joining protein LigD
MAHEKSAAILEQILTPSASAKESLRLEVDGFELNLTSLNKVFWPGKDGKGITKRDYLAYLVRVSPLILPHLKDRPITFIRFPNGIDGPKFYQKHWEKKIPPFVKTVRYFSEHTDHDNDFLLCNNLTTLMWLAQIADLELHTAHFRIDPEPDATKLSMTFTGSVENIEQSILNYPDFLVIDLDPYLYSGKEAKGEEPELHKAGFEATCDMALALKKEILDPARLAAFVKTSGRTGLHIYLPIVRNIDYATVRSVADTIGRYLMSKHPNEVTMEWSVSKRTGKVFFDHNMNARGKTLASIYSPRKSPEAPISTPLQWNELKSIYPSDFTLDSVMERLDKIGDLWADILDHKSDLRAIIGSFNVAEAAGAKGSQRSRRSSKTKATQRNKEQ